MPIANPPITLTRRLLRYGFRTLAILCVAGVALLAGSPFYIYARFTREKPVAELFFRQVGPQYYVAYVATGDFCVIRSYPLYGDQWRIDASFLKWTNFGTLLGLDSRYRLDRLSGRYTAVAEENVRPHQAYDLAPEVLFDIFKLGAIGAKGARLADTVYGSSAYMDIDVSRRYIVYKSQSGLFARSEPLAATRSADGRLTIRISRACGRKPGTIETVSRYLNSTVVQWLTVFKTSA